jgi:RND family efflux transporter MFP subunit
MPAKMSMEKCQVNWKKTVVICIVILLLAVGVVGGIYTTEPVAQRTSATKRSAMLVEVTTVESGTWRPAIVAMGTVRPELEIVLSPRVSGEIISISEAFTPGGFIGEGDVILVIDPADFEANLQERRSELQQATANLELELGRQDLAKRDYQELKGTISPEYKTLVLREPQLNSARAVVEAASVAVRRAELDLERTRIRAPFAAHILDRQANVGSQVSPGQPLGRLVGVDSYWVEAAVPVSSLQWIDFPDDSGRTGSAATVRNRAAWPADMFRSAQVHSLIGALENQTRLARVLLSVSDPLAHEPGSSGLPPLMVGSFVETRIDGKPIKDTIRIKRDHLRKNDTVWLMKDGVLSIQELEIVFSDQNHAYVRSGLVAGDRIVTTNLASVSPGAPLRLEGELE